MTEIEFQEWNCQHWKNEEKKPGAKRLSEDPIYLAGAMTGEAGEVFDVIKKAYRSGRLVDKDKLILEMGDVHNYFMKLVELYGLDMDVIRLANKEKIEKRYGEKGE